MSFPTSPSPSNWFWWSMSSQSNCQNLKLKHRENNLPHSTLVLFYGILTLPCYNCLKPVVILFNQWQVRDFERNGLNLTSSKREELLRLRVQIEELSLRYIQNLNDDGTFIPLSEAELDGLPKEFFEVWILPILCILIVSYVNALAQIRNWPTKKSFLLAFLSGGIYHLDFLFLFSCISLKRFFLIIA